MSGNRRHLVSRSRNNEAGSPAPRHQERDSVAPGRQPARQTELPPYEPPTCALSPEAQQKLDALRLDQDYNKYKKHLKAAISVVQNLAADSNERLATRKEQLRNTAERRRRQGIEDDDKPDDEVKAEQYAKELDKKVSGITASAEKAIRELIDYGDELSMQESIMKEVSENIAAAPAPQSVAPRRRRDLGSDGENEDEEDEVEIPAADPENLSAVELLKKSKEEYAETYKSKSLQSRYDYQL
jgi:hypothetical protein